MTDEADRFTNNRMNQQELYAELGRVVAARRKRLELTQTEVAAAAGMSRASLANIEVGRQNILVHQLYALATALKLDSPAKLLPVGPLERDVNFGPVAISESDLSDRQRAQIERVFLSVDPKRSAERKF